MSFESFPGIKTMALGYLMDNGLMDDAPKQLLALHVPGQQHLPEHDELGSGEVQLAAAPAAEGGASTEISGGEAHGAIGNEVRGEIDPNKVIEPGPKYRKRNEREIGERMRQLDGAIVTGGGLAGLAGPYGVAAGAFAQGGYALGRDAIEGWVRKEDVPAYENWEPEDIKTIVD